MAMTTEYRPCHGCRQHYLNCTCERRLSVVTYHLECPRCGKQMRIPKPKAQQWVQRCGWCFWAFDAKENQ